MISQKKTGVSPCLRLDLEKKCSKKPRCISGPKGGETDSERANALCDCTWVSLLVVGRTKKIWLRTWLYCIMLYIYTLNLYYFRFQTTVVIYSISNLQQGAHPQRMMNPNGGWCSWMGSKHTRFEWSVQKKLASKQWSYVICHPERWFLALSFSICTWQVDPNWSKLMFFEIRLRPPSILPRPHGTARPQRWSNAALGATKQKGCAIGQKSTCGVSQVLSSVCSG